MNRRSIS